MALATDLVASGMRKTFDWAIMSEDQDFFEGIEEVRKRLPSCRGHLLASMP